MDEPTLRDLFAIQVLNGLLSYKNYEFGMAEAISRAYTIADAMLEARK